MDSDEELEAALVASMEHAPEAKQRQVDADAELASTLQQQEFAAADAPRSAPRISPSRQCLVLQLPVELQRRCLRFVSIANLITGVRMVCKSFSSQAVEEARERVRALLHDALVSGFEAEAKAEAKAEAAAAEKSASDATDVVAGGGTSSGSTSSGGSSSSSSVAIAARGGGSDTPREGTRRVLPDRQRLLELAEAVESALVRHVAASSGAGGSSSGGGGGGGGSGGSGGSSSASSGGRDAVRSLTSKCRSISFNLSDAKNPELRARLLIGELTPAAFVRLSSQEMASASLRAERLQWHQKHLKCAVRPERSHGFKCDLYRCDGCGCQVTQVHRTIRAGQRQVDRARTYATCVECKARWEV